MIVITGTYAPRTSYQKQELTAYLSHLLSGVLKNWQEVMLSLFSYSKANSFPPQARVSQAPGQAQCR